MLIHHHLFNRMEPDMSKTVHHVELVEGAANTTPWGQRDRHGVRFPVANPVHLKYYKCHGRYKVTARVIRAVKVTEAKVLSTVGKKGRTGPGVATITPERLLALARTAVRVNMSKKRLIAIAADLGVPGLDSRKPPTNAQLIKRITERQALVLAQLETSLVDEPA